MFVENQSDRNIKVLRTNGGGEYASKAFKAFSVNHVFNMKSTAPCTPQHNKLDERRNKTNNSIDVRCMLKQRNTLHSFWG